MLSYGTDFYSTGKVCTPVRGILIDIVCMTVIFSSSSSYNHITGLYCGLGLLLGRLKLY